MMVIGAECGELLCRLHRVSQCDNSLINPHYIRTRNIYTITLAKNESKKNIKRR
jgi:hypothetical protein